MDATFLETQKPPTLDMRRKELKEHYEIDAESPDFAKLALPAHLKSAVVKDLELRARFGPPLCARDPKPYTTHCWARWATRSLAQPRARNPIEPSPTLWALNDLNPRTRNHEFYESHDLTPNPSPKSTNQNRTATARIRLLLSSTWARRLREEFELICKDQKQLRHEIFADPSVDAAHFPVNFERLIKSAQREFRIHQVGFLKCCTQGRRTPAALSDTGPVHQPRTARNSLSW